MQLRAVLIAALTAGLLGQANAQRGGGNNGNQPQNQGNAATGNANNNNNNASNNANNAQQGQNAAANSGNNANNANNGQQGNSGNANLCLSQDVISTGSEADGQGAEGSDAGQAASLTSNNNFIDFCQGKTITNGQQNKAGSCNPIPQGDIPAVGKMVSTVITSPKAGQDFNKNETFTVTMQAINLQAGSFTNPKVTYFAAPQQLNAQGVTIGHAHVSIQDMGGTMNPAQPLDPQQFVFFKGINDDGNGQGQLSATVTGGLLPGFYRVCTIMSSSNHLGVISPIAQRGVQDDCQKFTVGQGGGGGNGANAGGNNANAGGNNANAGGNAAGSNANAGNGGQNGANGGQNGGDASAAGDQGAANGSATPVTAAAASNTAAAAQGQQGQQAGQGRRGRGRNGNRGGQVGAANGQQAGQAGGQAQGAATSAAAQTQASQIAAQGQGNAAGGQAGQAAGGQSQTAAVTPTAAAAQTQAAQNGGAGQQGSGGQQGGGNSGQDTGFRRGQRDPGPLPVPLPLWRGGPLQGRWRVPFTEREWVR